MANLDPLMPLKEGHLLRVIAAGMLNSMILDNGQERIMLKGTAGKNVVSTTESVPRQDKPPATKQIFQEVPDPRIVTLDSKGNIKEIEREEIPLFLIKWMPQITALTEELYPPNYRFDLAGYSEKIGDRATLFTAQKHIVAATCLRLETERDALIVGEMGTGKTRMGAVVAAVMNYRRVLVACPPHLVSKWIRELENAVPEAEMLRLAPLV
jgi:SpoVK/Ycf46/Vps4 family AAA+-type ATPase